MANPRTLPGLGLTGAYNAGSDGWSATMNANLLALSAVAQLGVESMTAALPASPADGVIYIVPTAGANQWKVAVRDDGAWVYLTPKTGWRAWVKDTAKTVVWDGTGWGEAATGSVSIKDEGGTVVAVSSSINFVGAGVTAAAGSGGEAVVTIPGGGGSGSSLEGALTAPPLAATWIQQNFDATKTTLSNISSPVNGLRLAEAAFAYGNTNLCRYALKAIPGTKWDAKARIRRHTKTVNFMGWGLSVRNSASGQSVLFGWIREAGGIGLVRFSNDTTYNTFISLGGGDFPYPTDIWVRLRYDGTDCSFQVSADGVWWREHYKAAGSALWGFLSAAATHVGFGYNANNSGDPTTGQELDLLSWELTALP